MPRAVVIQDHLVENDGNHVLQKMPGISICRRGNMFSQMFQFFLLHLLPYLVWWSWSFDVMNEYLFISIEGRQCSNFPCHSQT